LCIDEFLPFYDAQSVLEECVNLKEFYTPAGVFENSDDTKIDPSYRNNEVAYLDSLYRDAPGRSRTLTALRKTIWARECKLLWHEGYTVFDAVNYSTWQEATVSHYGDGAFYKRHRDTKKAGVTHRLVTLVYYVHREPARFTGGDLVIWQGDESLTLQPKHNRAVVFPSFAIHEVERVRMTDGLWESARFSVNYWMGFR
jgi:predicted 2-oxoglutarate/Fe(II)-dependent dioxygenase YbiX